MLIRVNNGIQLLNSCRDVSRAMARGVAEYLPLSPTSSSVEKATETSFDDYHGKLTSMFVKLTVDQCIVNSNSADVSQSPLEIRRLMIFELALELLKNRSSGLVTLVVRFLVIMLKLNSNAAVWIEHLGLFDEISLILFEMIFDLMNLAFTSVDGLVFENSIKWNLLIDLCVFLERYAVSFNRLRNDVISIISTLLIYLWFGISNHFEVKCMNCESELAVKECLHERYDFLFPKIYM
jgi:hypothetical protein